MANPLDDMLGQFFYVWKEESLRLALSALSLMLQTFDPTHADVVLLSRHPEGVIHFPLKHPLFHHVHLTTWASAIHAFADERVTHQMTWRRILILVALARTEVAREFVCSPSPVALDWCHVKRPPSRARLLLFFADLTHLVNECQHGHLPDQRHLIWRARALWCYGADFLPPPGTQDEDEEEEEKEEEEET